MKGKNKYILVVDDEKNIVDVVKSYLEKAGFTVCEAFTGGEALRLFEKVQPLLVILDLMLPDLSGEEVCRQIRKKSPAPVLMLTAKIAEEDVIRGLGLGADDYVTKPFSPRQLVARVEALLRRTERSTVPLSDYLSYHDDLEIDGIKHEVRKARAVVNLTPIEFNILMTLAKYPHKTFTRDELITLTMGDDYDGYPRTVDTHIKNLRQKIETDPRNPQYILTVHGIGYRFGGET